MSYSQPIKWVTKVQQHFLLRYFKPWSVPRSVLGTDPNWTSPTVTVWLIDVCFHSVWRTVKSLAGGISSFRLWQHKQFLLLGSTGCGLLEGFVDRKTHRGKLLHSCGSTGARIRQRIDQIRTKNYFVLTERKMYPPSRTQGG